MKSSRFSRRRGNIPIAIALYLVLSTTVVSLFGSAIASNYAAKRSAENAGALDTGITIANLCATAFRQDLEAQSTVIPQISILFPNLDVGGQVSPELFEQGIANIQTGAGSGSGLMRSQEDDNSWYHWLQHPEEAVVSDQFEDSVRTYLSRQISGAEVCIHVSKPLSVSFDEGDSYAPSPASTVTIDPIEFTVEYTKGITKITQNYVLTGEKLACRWNESSIHIFVDGENAVCSMTHQSITRTNPSEGSDPISENEIPSEEASHS